MGKWRWYHGVLFYGSVQAVSFGFGKLVQTVKEQSKPKIDEQVLGNESYNEFYNNLKQPVFAPPDFDYYCCRLRFRSNNKQKSDCG